MKPYPVLLLHGLFDCTLSWKPIADQLSDRFDVHLFPSATTAMQSATRRCRSKKWQMI